MTPNNNITSSIEVVAPHQSIEETKQVREAVTQHSLANHPAFQPLNKPHPNGRMYKGLDKNGAVIGAAISLSITNLKTKSIQR
ncbi:hypothetical protein JCM19233_6164 [Vibrio astriarenae]|nr:hypothetical protein JCM19233_6164 [Vibrio sp. C7]